MYKTTEEARSYACAFRRRVDGIGDLDIAVCAPFTVLGILQTELAASTVMLGAQNMYYQLEGAYTGEISPRMLQDLACRFVILGHSERREYMKETDDLIGLKVKAALAHNLTPILCVGENLQQRETGQALKFVRGQVEKALAGINASDLAGIVIAYEPIWAIGTGKTATAAEAQEMCQAIRLTLAGMAGPAAQTIRILYGGSVKSSNISEFMAQTDIDGALVGGASLDADGFSELISKAR